MENRNRKSAGPQPFSQALRPLAKKLLGKRGFAGVDIIADWEQIAGPDIAARCRPEGIDFPKGARDGGTLRVAVASGAFAAELKHREKRLVERVNACFGYSAVAAVKIIQAQSLPEKPRAPEGKSRKPLVTAEERSYIARMGDGIESAPLKEALSRLGESILGSTKK